MTLAVGIDLATAGARAVAVDEDGTVLASASTSLPVPEGTGGTRLQQPAYARVARLLLEQVRGDVGGARISALSVTGTSGTVVPVDGHGSASGPAVLYDDATDAGLAARLSAGTDRPVGMLPRIARLLADASGVTSSAGAVANDLLGLAAPMDSSHALKAGIDAGLLAWDAGLAEAAGIDVERLPPLVAPGSVLGMTDDGIAVIAGMTDGCTSQIATGAIRSGNTVGVLGTTLVLKGVAPAEVLDPVAGVYSHRSPDGTWWPGAASNVGAGSIAALVPEAAGHEAGWDAAVAGRTGSLIVYPLPRAGERFPWRAPDATFRAVRGDWGAASAEERYLAVLQGVALVERWGLDALGSAGSSGDLHTVSGGGSRSAVWNQVRATVLGRPVAVVRQRDSAYGAALLALSAATRRSLSETSAAVHRDVEFVDPVPAEAARWTQEYGLFRAALGA